MADQIDRAVQAAMLKENERTRALRAIALELAQVAKLTLDRANAFQVEAGHPQRFLVATQDAEPTRPALRVVTPDGGVH